MMSDFSKAQLAVQSMFKLFERVPAINNYDSETGEKLNDKSYKPDIKLDKIEFTYPSRPDAKILRGINIEINNGQKVAFVGSSGCGKSTITQLIERFYDPNEGNVYLDNKNVRDLNLYWLRSQVGIVSQEPILFDLSIAENIAYGDNSREVPMDEIIEAAKKANIHDFITKLPQVNLFNIKYN
jgi:ABC-type multidrug transport system fused ATPase/permease subunit